MRWRIGKFAGTELWLHGATLLCWAYLLLQGQGMLLAVGDVYKRQMRILPRGWSFPCNCRRKAWYR